MSRERWQLLPGISEERLARMSSGLKRPLPPVIAQILYNRGIESADDIRSFLNVDERLGNDPMLLPDMEEALHRIEKAIQCGEIIAVYGDFDADGITATALLYEGLRHSGANVITYIPHRSDEGYGLNNEALSRLAKQNVKLVITVDCGVSAVHEIKHAVDLGLDVIVTDHHTVPSELPRAAAVINPKRLDSAYPFDELAGVGVAYKLIEALFQSRGSAGDIESYLDLVALGTVADMVSLLGENRYLVKKGLEVIRKTERHGIRELAKCAGTFVSAIDAETISWVLAPRLNAPGRLDHAGIGFRLLSTDSPEEAQKLAAVLERKNSVRQTMTENIAARAREQIGDGTRYPHLIMVGGEDFHSGVIGVVAGKLAEQFYRPAVVFERGSEWTRGSARSIAGVSIIDAIGNCSDILHRYGGHPMAAGFTVATEKLEELHLRLTDSISRQISSLDIRPHISIDAEVNLSEFQWATYKQIQWMAPFGSDNPPPVFLTRNLFVESADCVGNGDHLKMTVYDNKARWEAIAFRMGGRKNELNSGCRLDAVFKLEKNDWRGGTAMQLNIVDFARAE